MADLNREIETLTALREATRQVMRERGLKPLADQEPR